MADDKKPRLNPFIVGLIAGNMQAVGISFQSMDENSTGKDDVVGVLLVAGADVFQGYMQSNDGKLDRAMTAINKSSTAYLKSKGLPVAS